MRLLAPAKINLHLRVGPVSVTDGFHPVLTWMCTVALFDTLSFTSIEAPGLRFECDDRALPADGRNLVVRATALFGPDALAKTGLAISLEKRIPSGAGLGGGSSDAATTLLGINELLKLGRTANELTRLAAELGSDVPFFLHGPSSACTGRGELVKPIRRPTPKFAVLVLPGMHVPTPGVYRRFDEMNLGDARALDKSSQPDSREWSDLSADELLPRLINDLEPAAFSLEPALAQLHAQAQGALDGRIVRMSGSGSSLFTLFDDRPAADRAAARLVTALPGVRSVAVELAPDVNDDLARRP